MLGVYLENVRSKKPLIHNITNYVTVNDVANILLACGASPIMSDDAGEVEEITSACGGLCINIGTLNQNTVSSMLLAGKRASSLGRKTVLDPVGAGASRLRTETAFRLIEQIRFDVIRGNISEMKALALGSGGAKGGCRCRRRRDGGYAGLRRFLCTSFFTENRQRHRSDRRD